MILTIHIHPNAKQNSIEWIDADTAKVRIAAPATEGKANKALIEFLSETLSVPKSRLKIVRGLTARMKQVEVS